MPTGTRLYDSLRSSFVRPLPGSVTPGWRHIVTGDCPCAVERRTSDDSCTITGVLVEMRTAIIRSCLSMRARTFTIRPACGGQHRKPFHDAKLSESCTYGGSSAVFVVVSELVVARCRPHHARVARAQLPASRTTGVDHNTYLIHCLLLLPSCSLAFRRCRLRS